MFVKKLFILSALVIFSGFVQFAGIEILNAKPNFILSVLMAALFFVSDAWQGIFLAALASLMLKFSPDASAETTAFFATGLLAALAAKRVPAHPFAGVLILTAGGTLLMYLFLFVHAAGSTVFFKELAYNLILSSVMYYLLSLVKTLKQ